MSLQQEIVARALAGMRPCDIVRELNCARGTVDDYIWKGRAAGMPIQRFRPGNPKGSMTIIVSPHLRHALQPHADQRGIDPQELAVLILQCITDGQLVDAVLDDLDAPEFMGEDPA